jgi:DNA mismatch endonuclease (patch repair protein)
MMDPPVDPSVSGRFSRTRGRDTKPELLVRRELHRLGYRYRVNYAPVPGLRRTADVVFTKQRIAVFIDGCFWHGCPDHFVPPKTRAEFWAAKIGGNMERDADTTRLLGQAGWEVLRFWEHQTASEVVTTIVEVLSSSRLAPGTPSA